MRDEIDGRFWVDNHEAFADSIDEAIAAIRSGLARFASWDGTSHQLLVLVLSFAITALTFNTTTA